MKTIGLEQATLQDCVRECQAERVIVTSNGVPVAVIVGVEGLDEEQVQLGCSDDFWKLVIERRQQNTLSRKEFERRCNAASGQ